jgi:signal transduction histidine kinase
MSIHPLPPPKEPVGLGRLPIGRWFLLIGTVAGAAFLVGVVVTMRMIAEALALEPQPEVAAELGRLNAALIVLFGVLLACAAGFGIIARYAVLKPLDQLTQQVRTVAGGDFDHVLHVDRPAELAELSSHIDSMRRRIVSAWRVASEQAEELRRSNGELEQFAYVASHDLQEPLRKVSSFCQLLQRRYGGQLDERADQYIAFATDGAQRMQRLINDLLAFSRVGRTTSGFETVDLREIALAAAAQLETTREELNGEIVVGNLPKLQGDPVLLRQLLFNLIGNGLKFHRPDTPPVVRIEASRDGDVHEFVVRDNGIGIESEYAEKIFVIFQRLHGREIYSGTGIGLALVKKIVEFHGGRVWLDATPREEPGTVIRFTLPVETVAPTSVSEEAS